MRNISLLYEFGKGSRKKNSSLNGRAIKRGGGIKDKITFFEPFFQRSNGHKARGGGGGLNGPAIKRRTFYFGGFPAAKYVKRNDNSCLLLERFGDPISTILFPREIDIMSFAFSHD